MDHAPTRAEALQLLKEYNQSESLIRHALAVEAVMRHFARRRGADEELWGVVGLLHDLDYEKFPEQHCRKSEEILRERGWPAGIVRAVVSHGWGICSVKKKWKDKRFAAGVDRSIIEKGAAMLGVELPVLITETILGMRAVAEEIGLKGNPAS